MESSKVDKTKKPDGHKSYSSKDVISGSELWTDGLISAFEYIRGPKKPINSKSGSRIPARGQLSGDPSRLHVPENGFTESSSPRQDHNKVLETSPLYDVRGNDVAPFYDVKDGQIHHSGQLQIFERFEGSYWKPIGWSRISELVQTVQVDTSWASQLNGVLDDEDDIAVADVATPYWEQPAGPIWWCNVSASHPSVHAWLSSAQWLHPAIGLALRDESKLISERMKHLLYEVGCFQ